MTYILYAFAAIGFVCTVIAVLAGLYIGTTLVTDDSLRLRRPWSR